MIHEICFYLFSERALGAVDMTTPRGIVGYEIDNERLKRSWNCDQTQDEDVKKLKQSQFARQRENLVQMSNDLHGRDCVLDGYCRCGG